MSALVEWRRLCGTPDTRCRRAAYDATIAHPDHCRVTANAGIPELPGAADEPFVTCTPRNRHGNSPHSLWANLRTCVCTLRSRTNSWLISTGELVRAGAAHSSRS